MVVGPGVVVGAKDQPTEGKCPSPLLSCNYFPPWRGGVTVINSGGYGGDQEGSGSGDVLRFKLIVAKDLAVLSKFCLSRNEFLLYRMIILCYIYMGISSLCIGCTINIPLDDVQNWYNDIYLNRCLPASNFPPNIVDYDNDQLQLPSPSVVSILCLLMSLQSSLARDDFTRMFRDT
jgi:hypothetical protein